MQTLNFGIILHIIQGFSFVLFFFKTNWGVGGVLGLYVDSNKDLGSPMRPSLYPELALNRESMEPG